MDNIHTIIHIENPAPDLQKAMDFYSRVFGWEAEITPGIAYALFRIGDIRTGGGFDASLKPANEKTGPGLIINVNGYLT